MTGSGDHKHSSSSEAKYQLDSSHNNDGNTRSRPKVGHKCCGACCDMRRAVIIVNGINVVVILISLCSILATKNMAANGNYDTDDAELHAAMQEFNDMPMGGLYASMAIHFLATVIAGMGAYVFDWRMVVVGAVMYSYDTLMAILAINFGGLLYALFFAYPHFFFIQEAREGTMTRSNYHNEEHSCCCV